MKRDNRPFIHRNADLIRQESVMSLQALAIILFFVSPFSACQTSNPDLVKEEIPYTIVRLCTPCHGEDLKGNIAQSLLDGSWQFGARPTDIFRAIKFGNPQAGMPSWGGLLSDSDIDTLVSYLLRAEKRQGLSRPPIPSTLETQDYQIQIEVLAEGFDRPWGIAFIDSNRALVTEQSGQLRIVENDELRKDPVKGLGAVLGRGQGGLFDVVVDPNFEENGWVYISMTHSLGDKETDERKQARLAPMMTKVIRGRISANHWTDEQVLFEAPHQTYISGGSHFGGRMIIDTDGYLFFSIGDRDSINHAQDLSRPNGKIHRIHADGTIPLSNPFYGQEKAILSIYSYGNRNPQGLALHPQTGELWSTEHGPLGGDELNIILSGVNYGWPVICHGINYNGELISEFTHQEGMEQPIYYWRPSIAPCGLDFYRGDLFPKWKNRLLLGSLKQEELQLLNIKDQRVIYNETILKNVGRIRQVITGPEGAIYILLNRPGALLRLTPDSVQI
ncbi:MAG: hypothetical protein HKN87_12010 [Saprospiraceae bacterium]|nr:hypothetical protein [Saprospiraceae bacterium]